jgi:hypothetical protein
MATSKLSNNHNPQPDVNKHPEQLLYLTNDEMSTDEYMALIDHLANCHQCRSTRESVLSTRAQILTSLDKEVPPTTDSLNWIRPGAEIQSTLARVHSESRPLRLIRRISTVAALLLILIFIAEQARSVQHITNLEKRFSALDHSGSAPVIDQWTLYRVGRNWKELAEIHGITDSQLAAIGLPMITKLIENQELLQKLINSEITRRRDGPPPGQTPNPNPK